MSCNPGTPCYSTKVVYPKGCNTNYQCGVKKITTDDVVYSGANLPCSGINTCDTLTVVIQKIDTFLCESYICEVVAQCSTTTTTTTILPFTCNPCVTYLLINTTSVPQIYSWTDCYGVVYSDFQILGDQAIQICVCEGSLSYNPEDILAYPIGAGCHPVQDTSTTTTTTPPTTTTTSSSTSTTTTTTTIPG